jgi:hypothetical protein
LRAPATSKDGHVPVAPTGDTTDKQTLRGLVDRGGARSARRH